MKVSGFTFLRNAEQLGFPFVQSIQSALPLVDEFIVNVGHSQDNTLEMIRSIDSPKIRIIETQWNDLMRDRGFTYAQQKMIAQYSCTGNWAFYLEGDEVLHENDLDNIQTAMKTHLNSKEVEALVFDYLHFYGNTKTYAWSPGWYRRAPRIIKTSVRNFAPDGLFWAVIEKKNKRSRYPNAALANSTIYHYGWVRSEANMREKFNQVAQYWNQAGENIPKVIYSAIDQHILQEFEGSHPAVIGDFFPEANAIYQADPQHVLTKSERKHRLALKLEKLFNSDFSKKHFKLVSN